MKHPTAPAALKPIPRSFFAKNPDSLFFVPVSGVEEIGMNFYAYGWGGKWLLVDFGMGFASESPILPGIDLIFPSPQFFTSQKNNIVGLVLTHAHEDHIGAIPYLWPELHCPIYGTHFTLAVVREKLRESGFAHRVPLRPFAKNEPFTLFPFTITPYTMTHSILEQQALLIEVGKHDGGNSDDKTIAVFHTGDWKIDREPLLGATTDETALRALADRNIAAVISNSTNVFNNHPSSTEGAVQAGMIETFQKIEAGDYRLGAGGDSAANQRAGMIIVTCFASNLQRLFAIATAAEKIGRQVAVIGRAFDRYLKVAADTGYWPQFPKSLQRALTEADIKHARRDKLVVIATGSQGEPRGAIARIARFDHGAVTPMPGDYMLFSSRVIPGNETTVAKIKNNLVRAGVRLLDTAEAVDGATLHASGHPTRHDLKELYSWIKPRALIPIHGEPRHLIEHMIFAKQECGIKNTIDGGLLPTNGAVIHIPQTGPIKIIGQITADHLVKDGYDIMPIADPSLTTRHKLAIAGHVVVSAILKNNQLVEYRWSLLGIAMTPDQEKTMDEAIDRALVATWQSDGRQGHGGHGGRGGGKRRHRPAPPQGKARGGAPSEEEVARAIKRHVRKYFDKSPIVTIHFFNQ